MDVCQLASMSVQQDMGGASLWKCPADILHATLLDLQEPVSMALKQTMTGGSVKKDSAVLHAALIVTVPTTVCVF
jgi:hypothetical protein